MFADLFRTAVLKCAFLAESILCSMRCDAHSRFLVCCCLAYGALGASATVGADGSATAAETIVRVDSWAELEGTEIAATSGGLFIKPTFLLATVARPDCASSLRVVHTQFESFVARAPLRSALALAVTDKMRSA